MTSMLRQRYLLDPGRHGLIDAMGLRTYRFALQVMFFVVMCVIIAAVDPTPVNWWIYVPGLMLATPIAATLITVRRMVYVRDFLEREARV